MHNHIYSVLENKLDGVSVSPEDDIAPSHSPRRIIINNV